MSPRWSKLLERLGRFRLGFSWRRRLTVGDPNAPDALAGTGWRDYRRSDRLFDAWGPHPESPWLPYHCVPLFAVLDRLEPREIGPAPPPERRTSGRWARVDPLPPAAGRGAPRPGWLQPDTLTVLDLPGPTTIEAAAWLITTAGCQPVCTFDNWPHQKGILHPEDILAEMLRWATTIEEVRFAIPPSAPPLWICDSLRLGKAPGRPGQFDNRYYLDDSILPGNSILKAAGIREVVYVTLQQHSPPTPDIQRYLVDLISAGVIVRTTSLATIDADPVLFTAPRARPKFSKRGFRRSSAGGFGIEVPHESSGSSSG